MKYKTPDQISKSNLIRIGKTLIKGVKFPHITRYHGYPLSGVWVNVKLLKELMHVYTYRVKPKDLEIGTHTWYGKKFYYCHSTDIWNGRSDKTYFLYSDKPLNTKQIKQIFLDHGFQDLQVAKAQAL